MHAWSVECEKDGWCGGDVVIIGRYTALGRRLSLVVGLAITFNSYGLLRIKTSHYKPFLAGVLRSSNLMSLMIVRPESSWSTKKLYHFL